MTENLSSLEKPVTLLHDPNNLEQLTFFPDFRRTDQPPRVPISGKRLPRRS